MDTIRNFYKEVVTCNYNCPNIKNTPGTDWIPRGYGTLCKEGNVEILIIGKNPGHPITYEKNLYKNKTPDEILNIFDEFRIKLFTSYGTHFKKKDNKFHRNLLRYLCYFLNIIEYEMLEDFNKRLSLQLFQKVFSLCAFTNLVKCSTANEQEELKNFIEDTDNCYDRFLKRELEIFKPKSVLCLGGEVYHYIINSNINKNINIAKVKHPSYSYAFLDEFNKLKEIKTLLKFN